MVRVNNSININKTNCYTAYLSPQFIAHMLMEIQEQPKKYMHVSTLCTLW
jgi:hypothetical protein